MNMIGVFFTKKERSSHRITYVENTFYLPLSPIIFHCEIRIKHKEEIIKRIWLLVLSCVDLVNYDTTPFVLFVLVIFERF